MKPTQKQINQLIYLWENNPRASIQKYWNKIPMHNDTWPSEECNSRRLIIYDYLFERASVKQVSYMIYLLDTSKDRTTHLFRQVLKSLNK